jgi:hypothetical protein
MDDGWIEITFAELICQDEEICDPTGLHTELEATEAIRLGRDDLFDPLGLTQVVVEAYMSSRIRELKLEDPRIFLAFQQIGFMTVRYPVDVIGILREIIPDAEVSED